MVLGSRQFMARGFCKVKATLSLTFYVQPLYPYGGLNNKPVIIGCGCGWFSLNSGQYVRYSDESGNFYQLFLGEKMTQYLEIGPL